MFCNIATSPSKCSPSVNKKPKQYFLYKKFFDQVNHHQLTNFYSFFSNIINCQEQLKTTQQTEKKKK